MSILYESGLYKAEIHTRPHKLSRYYNRNTRTCARAHFLFYIPSASRPVSLHNDQTEIFSTENVLHRLIHIRVKLCRGQREGGGEGYTRMYLNVCTEVARRTRRPVKVDVSSYVW